MTSAEELNSYFELIMQLVDEAGKVSKLIIDKGELFVIIAYQYHSADKL